jgi:hypothetical protein
MKQRAGSLKKKKKKQKAKKNLGFYVSHTH